LQVLRDDIYPIQNSISSAFSNFRVSLQSVAWQHANAVEINAKNQEVAVIKDLLKDAESHMQKSIHALTDDLLTIRTGRANPALVEKLHVEYYGSPTPLQQLASISVPEPRQLMIKPFDKSAVKAIEKAIMASDLGLTPNNDGLVIRLNLPVLTEDRRRELVKHVHHRLEEARVALRNLRRDSIKDIKDFEAEKMISEDDRRHGEEEIQKLTDRFMAEVEKIGYTKEQEIMEV
jgi:ribosome recycling factor